MTHIHKYRKVTLKPSRKVVFRCILPDCSHYVRPEFYKGRKSICWRCGEPFVIEREHQRMAKPHCSSCIKRRDGSDEIVERVISKTDPLDDFMSQFRGKL